MTTSKVEPVSQREIDQPDVKEKKSDRFAQLLARKRKESDVGATGGSFALATSGQPQSVTHEPESVAAPAATRDMQQLANEIVSYMAAQATEGGHSLEIQFNTNTLQGLKVHLQSQQGVISVKLQTSLPTVARLLRSNLGSLQGALERKGATVAHLTVGRLQG